MLHPATGTQKSRLYKPAIHFHAWRLLLSHNCEGAMREDLLHFIWKFRKLSTKTLLSTEKQQIVILGPGRHNKYSGPDFLNARLEIGGQEWAGNVEMHLKASDWYNHGHEKDKNYQNVILHVVWENDVAVYTKDNVSIPTLELRPYLSEELLRAYHKLFNNQITGFINCEKSITTIDPFVFRHWLGRLFIERLEKRAAIISELLKITANDWERVLFMLLLKNFGSKINGAAFNSLGLALDYSVVRKINGNSFQLECILFGMAGLLDENDIQDRYYLQLRKEYRYLKLKYKLNRNTVIRPDFFKLRPPNFPTVRISQFAALYSKSQLFSRVLEARNLSDYQKILSISASNYWDNHYNFGKWTPGKPKKLSHGFIELLLINTIFPLKFSYSKYIGKSSQEEIIALSYSLKPENNSIINNFRNLKINAANLLESQAMLELYNQYCSRNKCLHCTVGNRLLNGK